MITFIIRHPLYFILSILLHIVLIGLLYLQNQIENPLSMASKKTTITEGNKQAKFKAEDALKKKLENPMKTYTVDSKLVQKQVAKIKRKEAARKQQQERLKRQNIFEAKKLADLKIRQKQENKKAEEAELKRVKLEEKKKYIEREILRKSEEKKKLEKAAIQAKVMQERLREEVQLQKQMAEEESNKRKLEKKRQLEDLRKIYIASIAAKVRENWRTPIKISNKAECELLITQTPKGHVSSVKVGTCNQYATPQFKKAAENAVYRTDPIPKPPKKELFERNIRFLFKP